MNVSHLMNVASLYKLLLLRFFGRVFVEHGSHPCAGLYGDRSHSFRASISEKARHGGLVRKIESP